MTEQAIVCPLCPLHCDDLPVAGLAAQCQRFAQQWTQATGLAELAAKVDRQSWQSDTQRRIDQARQWLDQAGSLVISGQATDLATARSVCRLVERRGAALISQPLQADGFSEALARDGMIACTLGEAAAPHQHLIVIGDPEAAYPRLGRWLENAASLYRWKQHHDLPGRLALLHHWLRQPSDPAAANGLADANCLQAASDSGLGERDDDLQYCWQLCRQQTQLVWVVGPLAGSPSDADVDASGTRSSEPLLDRQGQRAFWRTLLAILSELNRDRRASLLRLDPASTLRNVAAWTGTATVAASLQPPPGRKNHQKMPHHAGDFDLQIHLATAGDDSSPPLLGRRQIVIAAATPAWSIAGQSPEESASSTTLRLPAAIAGLSAAGAVIRGDGSVTLPLAALLPSPLPTAAQWLDRF